MSETKPWERSIHDEYAREHSTRLDFLVVPVEVARILSGCLIVLLLLHGFVLVMQYGFGHDHMYGLSEIFNVGNEHSVPTLFATLMLLINTLCFLLLHRAEPPGRDLRKVWLVLFLAFAFVTVDEYAVLHERLIRPVRELLDLGGYLYFAWVLPYVAVAAALGLYVLPALWRLGHRFRRLFAVAAGCYLLGAVGIEMLGARYYEAISERVDLRYRLFQTVEETLEFVGTIILAYTLLELLRLRVHKVTLRVG